MFAKDWQSKKLSQARLEGYEISAGLHMAYCRELKKLSRFSLQQPAYAYTLTEISRGFQALVTSGNCKNSESLPSLFKFLGFLITAFYFFREWLNFSVFLLPEQISINPATKLFIYSII